MEEYSTLEAEGLGSNDVVVDLTDVKEIKQLIPASKGVVMKISKASLEANDAGVWKWVKLNLTIVNGIDEEGKYKNTHLFQNVCYFADPKKYTAEGYKSRDYFLKNQHLVPLKYLVNAVGLELKGLPMNDEFIDNIVGKTVLADISQSPVKMNGEKTGEFQNEVRNFKPIQDDMLV